MKALLKMFGLTMDVANALHPTSVDELGADQHLRIVIGLTMFALAFIIYARYF